MLKAVELNDSRRIPLNAPERSKRKGQFPYYGANGLVDHIDSYIFDGEYILLAEDGGNFDKPERGVAYEVSGKFWVNNHAHILRPRGDMPPRFLRYWLNAIDWMPYVGGTTRAKLTQAGMSQVIIPLPPLPEQRQIVAKLDSLTGRTARAREELKRIPRLIQKYREAILAATFSGELTREWRQKQGIKPAWKTRYVGQTILAIVAGKNLRCEERPPHEDEKGVVKISAVTWGTFDASAAKTLPSNFVPPDHTKIRAGDFLISRANTLELVGAVVIVDRPPGNLFLSDKVLRLEMPDIHKRWLLWFLRSPAGRVAIEESATGNRLSMRNLSQAALSKIIIPWPKDEEREEIVPQTATLCSTRPFSECVQAYPACLK